jgi:hypothetical protein
MAKIEAAEILAGRYPEVFGKKAPEESAAAVAADVLNYTSSGETTTKSDLAAAIRDNGEMVLRELNHILASSEFQDLVVLREIAVGGGIKNSPRIDNLLGKIDSTIDLLKKPDVPKILRGDLKEVRPLHPKKRVFSALVFKSRPSRLI